jgi:hypothetical protein
MAKNYTNLLELTTDFSLYMALRLGQPLTLDMYPSLSKNRFKWFVDNWVKLYKRFNDNVGGDQVVRAALTELDRTILAYKLGSNQNPFEDNAKFVSFLPFMRQITLTELSLVKGEKELVDRENSRILKFSIPDFRSMILYLRTGAAQASSLIGKGDVDGGKLFGVEPQKAKRQSTFQDFEQMERVIALQQIIEGVIFDLMQKEDRPPNLLEISNKNIAPGSSVSVNTAYRSVTSVPFSISLEHMAQKHLGDRTKWYELVTVNNLQPPFVDEFGEKFNLVSPGSSGSVTIPDIRSMDIPVAQSVAVGSLKFKEERRVIEKKITNGDGTITLFLSGTQNLSSLLPKDQAYVRVFKPHTVNSGSFIMIPSDVRSPVAGVVSPKKDSLRRLDKALVSFGIDIKRDLATNDILIDQSGNFQLSVGMDNIRQAIHYAVRTTRGELPFHQNSYGIILNIGDVYYGSQDEAVLFSNILIDSLKSDNRYKDIKVTDIKFGGTSMSVTMEVLIEGSDSPIPLSFAP